MGEEQLIIRLRHGSLHQPVFAGYFEVEAAGAPKVGRRDPASRTTAQGDLDSVSFEGHFWWKRALSALSFPNPRGLHLVSFESVCSHRRISWISRHHRSVILLACWCRASISAAPHDQVRFAPANFFVPSEGGGRGEKELVGRHELRT